MRLRCNKFSINNITSCFKTISLYASQTFKTSRCKLITSTHISFPLFWFFFLT